MSEYEDEEFENAYDDEEFENEEDEIKAKPTSSSTKKPSTPPPIDASSYISKFKSSIANLASEHQADEESEDDNEEEEEGKKSHEVDRYNNKNSDDEEEEHEDQEENEQEASNQNSTNPSRDHSALNLEKYLSNIEYQEPANTNAALDGVSPPKTHENKNHTKNFESPDESPIKETDLKQLIATAEKAATEKNSRKNVLNDPNTSLKVDALLQDLFPERYREKEREKQREKEREKEKKKKIVKKSSKEKELLQNSSFNSSINNSIVESPQVGGRYYDEDDEEDDVPIKGKANKSNVSNFEPTDVLSSLDHQLKLLKKEIKTKDEKISRLTDHSNMIASQMDKLKGEVARLNSKLHEAYMELEAKENRLQEALKNKKKEKKKLQQIQQDPSDNPLIINLENENIRLKEREQALMEAVEELSLQNEDLLYKLKESMQRELESSSKRAALVSQNIFSRTDSTLPSIHESNMLRTNSEPNVEYAQNKSILKKKKKKSHY